MAKGQKRSGREPKKPKKTASEKLKAGTSPSLMPELSSAAKASSKRK